MSNKVIIGIGIISIFLAGMSLNTGISEAAPVYIVERIFLSIILLGGGTVFIVWAFKRHQ